MANLDDFSLVLSLSLQGTLVVTGVVWVILVMVAWMGSIHVQRLSGGVSFIASGAIYDLCLGSAADGFLWYLGNISS